MDLNNNVALITGGASGLGRATLDFFVSKGAKAVILDINDEKATEAINALGSYDCGLAYTDFSDDGYGADEDAFVFSVSASL
jgi:3-hydroxyacyl-CoA dehydrogenase/3-hydroxy-2-methylbutyryl-CoA dehydrogenase